MPHALVTLRFEDEDEAKQLVASFEDGDGRIWLKEDSYVWAKLIAASIPDWQALMGAGSG